LLADETPSTAKSRKSRNAIAMTRTQFVENLYLPVCGDPQADRHQKIRS